MDGCPSQWFPNGVCSMLVCREGVSNVPTNFSVLIFIPFIKCHLLKYTTVNNDN